MVISKGLVKDFKGLLQIAHPMVDRIGQVAHDFRSNKNGIDGGGGIPIRSHAVRRDLQDPIAVENCESRVFRIEVIPGLDKGSFIRGLKQRVGTHYI